MKRKFLTAGIFLAMLVILSGCQNSSVDQPEDRVGSEIPVDSENATQADQAAGLANPASQNCLDKGGQVEMRTNKGGEYGVCIFKDNRQCEEWALLSGECPAGGVDVSGYKNAAEIYCAVTGGQVEGAGTKVPMCKRTDGTLCTAQANLDGECPDPADPEPDAGNAGEL